jgi:DNA-binding FadR family transcriptional regulator
VVEHDPQRAEQVMTQHLADVATRLQTWASEDTPGQ